MICRLFRYMVLIEYTVDVRQRTRWSPLYQLCEILVALIHLLLPPLAFLQAVYKHYRNQAWPKSVCHSKQRMNNELYSGILHVWRPLHINRLWMCLRDIYVRRHRMDSKMVVYCSSTMLTWSVKHQFVALYENKGVISTQCPQDPRGSGRNAQPITRRLKLKTM